MLVIGVLVAAACGGGDDANDAHGGEDGAAPSNGDATTTTDVLDNPRWASVVSGPEASDEEPRGGGSIVVALQSEANSYLPSVSTVGQPGVNVAYAIFDPLVARDANGEIRPYLAESIEPNADFSEWTLTLRPNVQFHDGTLLNAEALKRNWDDYLTAPGTVSGSVATQSVERMEVVDEQTVRYVLSKPNPTFPDLLELQLGWPFSPDAADALGDEFGERPVGTGPFKFVGWQRDNEFVVERNEDYWQEGLPYLDEIRFRPIPDDATRAVALESGDVDAVQGRRLSEFVADVAAVEDATVVLGLGNAGDGVLFNTDRPPTDDVRIRQALAHAVDQGALIEVAAGEAAELVEARTQFFPRGSPFYSEAVAEASLGYEPDRARKLYEEYVNDPQRSDGKEVGEPVSIEFTTLSSPRQAELGMAYKAFYEEAGFEVTVQLVEEADRTARAVSGDYQVQTFGKGLDRSPLGEFSFWFGDPEKIVTNFTRFHDDTIGDVIERLQKADDLEQQAALADEMGKHLAEHVPWQWTGSAIPLIGRFGFQRGVMVASRSQLGLPA
jgi:peptide/nickel transport system substrate-binding protein